MRSIRRRWGKWVALSVALAVPLGIVRSQQSWLPRKVGTPPSSYSNLKVSNIIWSRDGKRLVVNYVPTIQYFAEGYVADTEHIQVWDVGRQALIRRSFPYGYNVAVINDPSLAWSPDGRYFAINTQEDFKRTTKTRVIDAKFEKIVGTTSHYYDLRVASTMLLAHCWSSDGLWLRTVFAERTDAVTRAYFKAHVKMDGVVFALPDKDSRRGDIIEEQRDWKTGHLQKRTVLVRNGLRGGPDNFADKKTLENATFSPNGQCLAVIPGNPRGGLAKHIFVYDVASGARSTLQLSHPAYGKALTLAPLSLADKTTLACLASPQDIEVWNYRSGRTICKMRLAQGSIRGLVLSPDGSLLASSSSDWHEGISLWDATTGDLLRTMGKDPKREQYAFSQIAFSPDSATLAATHETGTVTLWRVK